MSDLRTAAKLALEAMSNFESLTNGLYKGEFAKEIAALKTALVEDAMQKFTDVNQELEAALADTKVDPQAIAKQPSPPPEAQTEAEKIAYCAGWWAAMEAKR